MKENRNITFRNYIILSVVLIISIIVVIYFYMWYGELKINNIYTPVMNHHLSVINHNEIDTYLIENKNVIIYVSILDDENTRNFEKKFKRVINKYSLNSSILYMNLTDEYYNNNKLFNSIKEKYQLVDMPCIITFEDGKVSDIYSIKRYNYDIELLVSYLRIKGVIYD